MIRYRLFPMLTLLLAACSQPPDLTPLDVAGGAIVVKEISAEPPLDPADARWQEAAPGNVMLYPQRSVAPASGGQQPLDVTVRALHDGERIALRLEWSDAAAAQERHIGRFADAVAVQWPLSSGSGGAPPYIGMGQPDAPVALWLWRAGGDVETLAAEGFGTLTAQDADGVQVRGEWRDGRWRVVFRRAMKPRGEGHVDLDYERRGLIPLALAVWNGEDGERNGAKRLSAWRVLYLEDGAADDADVLRLAQRASVQGDAENGRRLMMERGCAGCHAFPDNPARPVAGPGLGLAGGIHWAGYLQESLAEPSKVIVPGKGFYMLRDGERTSIMPPFQGTEQERQDVVAYLKTLR